jgi:hypothetical protein
MLRIVLGLLICLGFFSPVLAQRLARHSVVAGTGLTYYGFPVLEGYYQHQIYGPADGNIQALLHVGVSNHRILWEYPEHPTLQAGGNLLIDQNRDRAGPHYWEIATGGIIWVEGEQVLQVIKVRPYLEFGYRRQPRHGGWLFRVFIGTKGIGLSTGWVLGR